MKLNHWSKDMKEVCLVTTHDGVYNFRIAGGSDKGEFPIISDVLPPDTRGVEYKGGGELVTQVGYNNNNNNININNNNYSNVDNNINNDNISYFDNI